MDFVVLTVNGQDLSNATHEETIEAFTGAKEPILVEVLRRTAKPNAAPSTVDTTMTSPSASTLCESYAQTEWTGGWDGHSVGIFPFGQTSLMQSGTHQMALLGTDVISNHYGPLVGEADQDEDDMEYEEITLHRSSGNSEKLGLTLCYGAPDEADTDIYVSEIEPDSVAAKDGRVQEGDQLLQINGVEVHNREQAVALFSENRSDFTLLMARPQLRVEDYLLDDSAQDLGICQGYGVLLEEQDEEDGTTDTGTTENASNLHEKDSGVGRTDESTKNDESSEHEGGETCSVTGDHRGSVVSVPAAGPPPGPGTLGSDHSSGEDSEKMLQQKIVKLEQELERKAARLGGDRARVDLQFQRTPLCRFQSDASLDREMALLNQEMENIQLECESLVNRHLEEQKGKSQQEHVYVNLFELRHSADLCPPPPDKEPLDKKKSVERWVNSMVLGRGRHGSSADDRDTSSAYNTADSSGSVPLTLELSPLPTLARANGELYGSVMSLVSPRMEDKGTQLHESDVASIFSCESCRKCCRALIQSDRESSKCAVSSSQQSKSSGKKSPGKTGLELDASKASKSQERNKNYVTFYPCTTMYTNQANLQHTIWLQQQLFRQALVQQHQPPPRIDPRSNNNRGQKVLPSGGGLCNYLSSPTKSAMLSTVKEEDETRMEWKVKRRADGTRYITRRPVRNRLLKARALKIMEERCGLTTDDDTVSELKVGRYWTKEERKRHLERARDRKRKETVLRTKMASVKEQGEENEESAGAKKEVTILELSHKKLMKKRGKAVFDDFTTVQEVLVHGTKGQTAGTKPLGLLSVTTV